MWTKRSYNAVHDWIDANKRPVIKKILMADGLADVVERLERAKTMKTWHEITMEAAAAVGPKIVEVSANEAERELSAMAAALGKKGGSVISEKKSRSSAENGRKGGRKNPVRHYHAGQAGELVFDEYPSKKAYLDHYRYAVDDYITQGGRRNGRTNWEILLDIMDASDDKSEFLLVGRKAIEEYEAENRDE